MGGQDLFEVPPSGLDLLLEGHLGVLNDGDTVPLFELPYQIDERLDEVLLPSLGGLLFIDGVAVRLVLQELDFRFQELDLFSIELGLLLLLLEAIPKEMITSLEFFVSATQSLYFLPHSREHFYFSLPHIVLLAELGVLQRMVRFPFDFGLLTGSRVPDVSG